MPFTPFCFEKTKGEIYISEIRTAPKYNLFKFIGDVFMVCLTAGFWLIWIFVREMRRR